LRPQAGQVRLDGARVGVDVARSALRRAVGIVGQDPDAATVASLVFEEVAFGPCNLGLDRPEVDRRVAWALGACGLAGFEGRQVATLSGGERQRLVLAGVLAMRPAYLLLDEPCSMLDERSRRRLLANVDEVAAAGTGVLHVTHELEQVIGYDRALIVDGGRIVWGGTPTGLLLDAGALELSCCLVSPWLAAARDELAAGRLRPEDVAAGPECCAAALERARAGAVLGRLAGPRGRSDGRAGRQGCPQPSAPRGPYVLEARDVVLPRDFAQAGSEAGDRARELSLGVGRGGAALVAGASGSGKTSLVRVLAGLLEPASGRVLLEGKPLVPGRVACAFQRPEDQLFAATVLEDVAFGPRNAGRSAAEAREAARRALELVGFDPDEVGARSPFALSGGQMRRVALAGVLALEAPALVLDEPTVGLDRRGVEDLLAVLDRVRLEGRAVCVATHDVERFAGWADAVLVLEAGRAVYEGPYGGLFAADGHGLETQSVRFARALANAAPSGVGGVR
jgi:energy-coupling factor transport system ATP-binding protein